MASAQRWMVLVAALLAASAAAAADIATITRGSEVDLERHLVPGKLVLFDFYAEWCGPCRALEPELKRLAERHADSLALRKVDIVDWSSPVSRQHRISSVPHLKLYGPDGEVLAQGSPGGVLNVLERRLRGVTGGHGVPARERPPGWPLAALVALLAVAAFVLLRRPARSPAAAPAPPPAAPVDADGDPAVWFVMIQGALEGPYTVAQLGDLRRRRLVDGGAGVRRRGDASWTRLDDLLG